MGVFKRDSMRSSMYHCTNSRPHISLPWHPPPPHPFTPQVLPLLTLPTYSPPPLQHQLPFLAGAWSNTIRHLVLCQHRSSCAAGKQQYTLIRGVGCNPFYLCLQRKAPPCSFHANFWLSISSNEEIRGWGEDLVETQAVEAFHTAN